MHEHEPDRGKAVREFQPTMTEDQLAADYDVYPRFRNDIAVSEIRIGAKEFKCIGVSPPHDHPHVYIDMANQDTILCPYCGHVSASIGNWGHSRPIRLTAYTPLTGTRTPRWVSAPTQSGGGLQRVEDRL